MLLFLASFILNFQPYLFTAIKVGSSSLLKPWPIKTEQVLLLWHEATITLHFNVGLWYIVLPLRSILLRKFIGVDERSEETTLYSGRNHPLLLFHKFYNVDTMVQKSSKIVAIVNL